jgi:transcription elongation factor Elf1
MEGKAYTSRSNAKRAALKEYPEGNYEIYAQGEGFAFRGLEIEIAEDGEKFVDPAVIDGLADYQRPAAQAMVQEALYAEPPMPPSAFANMFGGLVQGADSEVAARVLAASHTGSKRSHKLDDNEGGCPLCGAVASSVTLVDSNQAGDDDRRDCHECGRRFNARTGIEIKYGYTKTDVARGHKIEKNRETQNGITRPSAGTLCRAVWDACDEAQAAAGGTMPSAKDMRKVNDDKGWNMNNTLIEYYQWRKFMGYSKKRGA